MRTGESLESEAGEQKKSTKTNEDLKSLSPSAPAHGISCTRATFSLNVECISGSFIILSERHLHSMFTILP